PDGWQTVPINKGQPCVSTNACITDTFCDGAECSGPPAPWIDDGNACTQDTCDPATGQVTHTAVALCDSAATDPGNEFETQGSLLGRVVLEDGTPGAAGSSTRSV